MTAVTAKRFSIAEYHRLGELGFFAPDDRIELIRGEIIIMAAKGRLHSVCNSLLVEELIILLARRARVRVQEAIILTDDSEPQMLLLEAIEPIFIYLLTRSLLIFIGN